MRLLPRIGAILIAPENQSAQINLFQKCRARPSFHRRQARLNRRERAFFRDLRAGFIALSCGALQKPRGRNTAGGGGGAFLRGACLAGGNGFKAPR